MQSLARQGLTAQQITDLLLSPALDVDTGLELVNADLTVRADITGDLLGGQVSRTMGAPIHGTCDLQVSRELVWGVDLVRPYMLLTDTYRGVGPVRFDCGVFSLTTPVRKVGETPVVFAVSGFDRLVLLQREVGREYTVAAGVSYRAALLQVFTDAGLTGVLVEGAAADSTLPVARVWPLFRTSTDPDQTGSPVTWLRIVNDLLGAINFRGVWCDESGRFRCQSYLRLETRASEFTLSADDVLTGIVGPDRTVTRDVWATPNRWVAVAQNPPAGVVPSEANGLVQVRENVADGITSQQARGLVYPRVLSYEAATPAALGGLEDRAKAADLRSTGVVELLTGPLPIAGHADVVTLADTDAGIQSRAAARSWRLPLSGEPMTWTFELLT